jgi:hypothetical protein
MVYVAFVIDAFSRRITGWRAATTMTTALVLDASSTPCGPAAAMGQPIWPGWFTTTMPAAKMPRSRSPNGSPRPGQIPVDDLTPIAAEELHYRFRAALDKAG